MTPCYHLSSLKYIIELIIYLEKIVWKYFFLFLEILIARYESNLQYWYRLVSSWQLLSEWFSLGNQNNISTKIHSPNWLNPRFFKAVARGPEGTQGHPMGHDATADGSNFELLTLFRIVRAESEFFGLLTMIYDWSCHRSFIKFVWYRLIDRVKVQN